MVEDVSKMHGKQPAIAVGVVSKDEHSAYGIWFPDVPGCFSAGDTLEDLRANAIEALSLWAEDQLLPDMRDHDAILADADVSSELAAGGFLFAVPVLALTGRTVKANITLDAGLLNALDATAKQRGMTRSALIADMARREVSVR
jgi:predicted RNase H-like HicB family nuclease